ncbi:hypothetical protein BCR36DRAFT_579467 [Piromyces finnis]|uniref:CAAX prenyl protease 2/Lysostaphin resistance protein A-like domain-containing protein n=1 Tax=Piromyces finnis TaxID=1754191 RepID=A0A1Y1VN38_9FUNG|nr:hypothetical protein BCR36DRAFT_579467 [Piromyces finnis]|eukprot:ORX60021.1 hypothetical protein BCR36DRAFT_579467 [Piromyces finnis]
MALMDNDSKIEIPSLQEHNSLENVDNNSNDKVNNNNNKITIKIPNNNNKEENEKRENFNPLELIESKGIDELDYEIQYSNNEEEEIKKYSRHDSMIDIPASTIQPDQPIKYIKPKKKGSESFFNQFFLTRVYVIAVISALLILSATIINGLILRKYSRNSSNEEGIQGWKENYKVFSYFYIILISPIAEEIVFRKILYGYFKRFSKLIGYLVSCFVYAMAHFSFSFRELYEESSYFPIYFIIGVILTYTYDFDGFLASSILSNIIYSTIILLFDITY